MKTSCIQHPSENSLVIIREDYLAITGDHCQAALLNYFEHWTNGKLSHQKQHKIEQDAAAKEDITLPDSDLWIYATYEQIVKDILGLYKRSTVIKGLNELIGKEFLSRRENPRYKWDHTPQYLFNTTTIQNAIDRSSKNKRSGVQNETPEPDKSRRTIPKTNPETSLETKNSASDDAVHKQDDMYNAIRDVLKLHGGRNGQIRKLLEGTADKPGYAEFNITPAVTPDELRDWEVWYHDSSEGELSIVQSPAKIQSSIYQYREEYPPFKYTPPEETKGISLAEAASRSAELNALITQVKQQLKENGKKK